ncbi:MAG: hypothetical protein IIC10_02260 [Proteobacteria bacterium]|nr:hypothetical protein [Pseudomonadota bacterium]
MSDDKQAENDPERTLLTLDQLSQTIEVMTSVVNRLRLHLGEQIKAQIKSQQAADMATETNAVELGNSRSTAQKRESFIVELSQPEIAPVPKSTKTLH